MEFQLEISVSHYVKIEFQLEIGVSHYAKMEFHFEIGTLHYVEMKFHFEINVSHYVKIEFQLEIDTSHYVKVEFQLEIITLHYAEVLFRIEMRISGGRKWLLEARHGFFSGGLWENYPRKEIREAENSREGLGAPPRTAENTACRTRQRPFLLYGCILKGHPEFSSGSHRESFL